MMNTDSELDRLNEILKKNPKGLTIAEIAKFSQLNRISTSKYLNIMLASGIAEMRIHGPSKVFYPSQRVPISSLLNFSTSLLLVMNDNLSIIDANNALLNMFSLTKKDLIGHQINYSPLGSYIDSDLQYRIQKALDSKESCKEVKWMICEEEKYLTIKITPTVFEDGNPGVTLIADDVTEITQYRLNLEQLVEERSKELKLINEQLTKEIESHKKARTKLQKSEQKYRELVENANCLIIRFDITGNITFVNEYAEQFLGYSEQDLVGNNLFSTFIPEIDTNGKNIRDFGKNLLDYPTKNASTVCEVIKKDNTRGWVSWTNKKIEDSHGNITGFLAIGNDITGIKLTKEALKSSEQRYRTLYHDNPSMFFTLDTEGTIISVNTFGAMQLGYTVDELVGQPVLKLVFFKDHQLVLNQLHNCLQNPGRLYQWQFRKINKTGNILWVKEDAKTEIGPNGIKELFIVSHDFTHQKQVEEKLAAIIDFLPDATFVIDVKGTVIAWNHAIETMTGVKAENIIGKGNHEYSAAIYNTRNPILIDFALKPDQEIPLEYYNCKREGDVFFAETYNKSLNSDGIYLWGKASPLYDSSGNLIGAVESFRDITSMKKFNTT